MRKILLVLQILITRDENIKMFFSQLKQCAVRDSSPTLVLHRRYFKPGEETLEHVRCAFVQKDLHFNFSTRCSVARENLSTSNTCSRETVGKFSKNSSIDTPASRLPSKASTGTRVPRKTGVPPRISGSTVMGSEVISCASITNDISGLF